MVVEPALETNNPKFPTQILVTIQISRNLKLYIGVSKNNKLGVPQNGWFIMETLLKWMIWGYPYFFGNTHIEPQTLAADKTFFSGCYVFFVAGPGILTRRLSRLEVYVVPTNLE